MPGQTGTLRPAGHTTSRIVRLPWEYKKGACQRDLKRVESEKGLAKRSGFAETEEALHESHPRLHWQDVEKILPWAFSTTEAKKRGFSLP